MGEKLVSLDVDRDGYILASDTERALNVLAEAFVARFECAEAEIRKLRADLETERRLRLGMRK